MISITFNFGVCLPGCLFKAKYFRKFCCLDALFSTVQNWSGCVTDIGWLQKTGFCGTLVAVAAYQWPGHAQWPCPSDGWNCRSFCGKSKSASKTNLWEPKHRGCHDQSTAGLWKIYWRIYHGKTKSHRPTGVYLFSMHGPYMAMPA